MTIRNEKAINVRGVAVLLAVVAIIWAIMFRDSASNAVPAGTQHAQGAVTASPDGKTDDPTATNSISVPFIKRGYCYAGSNLKDSQAIGGFGESDNRPRNGLTPSNGRGLFLLAQPGVALPFSDGPGMRLTLVNQTHDLLAFAATDSRLAITQEAQDADDTWKPIEHLPSTVCGNSYHRVFLAPNQFWEFPAPRYRGRIPTKLRFALTLADGSQLYSNVFDGSVNPGQFTVKQRSSVTGLDSNHE